MNPRTIRIRPVLNGFIVEVGCQTVVFKSPQELAENIAAYYINPAAMETVFIKSAVNKTMEGPHPVCDEELNRAIAKMTEPTRYSDQCEATQPAPRGIR